jgi:PIN domain nuclease of toxin-antitoxin system
VVAGPYLVDTSTAIWTLENPGRLSGAARRALEKGPLVISVVSYWEVVIKAQKGLFQIADPVSWWSRVTGFLGGEVLSIRAAHVAGMAALPYLHRDPFDRMLIAQAAVEGFALVSSDEMIGRYAGKVVW